MKHLSACLAVLLVAGTLTLRAAGPEDQYVAIYYQIQQGDAAGNAGNPAEATARYKDALAALQQLQRGYPTWQTNVVGFRLNYLGKRIAELAGSQPALPVITTPPTATATTNAEYEAQVAALQAQMQVLQTSNASLQAKLREALAAQPAAVDPAQLARAEEQIRELSKQNELLKVSLSDAEAKATAAAGAKQIAQLRQELDEANRKFAAEAARTKALLREKGDLEDRLNKTVASPRDNGALQQARRRYEEAEQRLAGQKAASEQLAREKNALAARLSALENDAANAAALRAENELLKRQVAELRAAATPAATPDLNRRLAAAEAQIAALKSERDILQLERSALESRVKQLMAAAKATVPVPPPSTTDEGRRIQQLEAQVEALQRQLAAATRDAGQAGGGRAEELVTQIGELRAKLAAYEAKPVPYTSEELALFRAAPPQLAATDQPVRKNVVIPRPPPGTGGLVVEAQRHFARGEFAQAEEKYRQVLQKDEQNVYTLANLAAIQLEEGKFDDAERNLRQALTIAPDDVYSLQTLGFLKFRQEKFDDALTALSRAAQLSPDSAEIQNYLGVTLSHQGQRAAAEQALRRAIQLEPGYGSAHNNLAVIYASQNPPLVELARWHYQRARDAGHPRNPELEKLFEQRGAAPKP